MSAAKGRKGICIIVYLKIDATATTAVTAVGTTLDNKFFAMEGYGTRSAFSRTQCYLYSINKQSRCLF